MKKGKRWTVSMATLFLAATLAPVQEPPTPVFRVTSAQVLFEFIAIDEKGHPVRDLRLDEMEVTADGAKQKLDFLIPPGEGNTAGYVNVGQLVADTGSGDQTGEKAGANVALKPAQVPLQTAILLDSRVLDASNFAHSVDAIRAFIDRSLRADSHVMLAEIDRGLKVVTPLTQDRDLLLKGVETLQPATLYNSLDRKRLLTDLGSSYFDDLLKQVTDLRTGLSLLCRVLSAAPGRKHIVFFSEGYPLNPVQELEVESRQSLGLSGAASRQAASRSVGSRKDPGVLSMVREVVSLANTYGVKFYTVDARGLVAVPGVGEANVSGDFAPGPGQPPAERFEDSAASETGLSEVQVANLQLTQVGDLSDATNTLVALAAGTNGSAYYNTNDLGIVLRASTAEDHFIYLGSFTPKLKGKEKFRRLQVKCKRKGLIIRSQSGFTDYTPQQALSLQLSAAFERPEFFQGLKPLLDVQPGQGGAEVVMGLPGAQVAARPQGEMFHLALAFAGRVYDSGGKPVSSGLDIQRGFAPDVTRDQLNSLAGQPLLARESLKLPSGKHRIVLVAIDQVTGALGTAVSEFSVR